MGKQNWALNWEKGATRNQNQMSVTAKSSQPWRVQVLGAGRGTRPRASKKKKKGRGSWPIKKRGWDLPKQADFRTPWQKKDGPCWKKQYVTQKGNERTKKGGTKGASRRLCGAKKPLTAVKAGRGGGGFGRPTEEGTGPDGRTQTRQFAYVKAFKPLGWETARLVVGGQGRASGSAAQGKGVLP